MVPYVMKIKFFDLLHYINPYLIDIFSWLNINLSTAYLYFFITYFHDINIFTSADYLDIIILEQPHT